MHTILRVSVLIALLAACGPEASSQDDSAVEYLDTPAGRHLAREDFIVECMLEAGFDYLPVPYYDTDDDVDPVEFVLELDGTEEVGYHSTRSALLIALTPRGEPGEPLGENELRAYDEALTGSIGHDDEGHDGEGHDDKGCRSLALGEFPEPGLVVETQDIGDMFERLQATPEFADFDEAWSLCMEESGFDTQDTSVIDYPFEQDAELFDAADSAIEEAGLDKDDGERLGLVPVVTTEAFDGIYLAYPSIGEVAADELRISSVDRSCRTAAFPLVQSVVAELNQEIRGQEYGS